MDGNAIVIEPFLGSLTSEAVVRMSWHIKYINARQSFETRTCVVQTVKSCFGGLMAENLVNKRVSNPQKKDNKSQPLVGKIFTTYDFHSV